VAGAEHGGGHGGKARVLAARCGAAPWSWVLEEDAFGNFWIWARPV
jgi:hypothetical protein